MSVAPRSILITGASTGIGHALAIDLARSGHQVFASVRKADDAKKLEAENSNIVGVIFDVCDEAGLQSAIKTVRERLLEGRALDLVNNAGVAIPGPLEELPLAEFRRQFEINVFGALRVIQVFLPLIRGENGGPRGRIVNMSSVAGRVTAPFLGAYSASKFALEAMSDALRRELGHEGIKVLLIEPGMIATPIWGKGQAVFDFPLTDRYRKPLERFIHGTAKMVERSALPVEVVTEAVRRALFEDEPPHRQLVAGLPMRLRVGLASLLPSAVMDRMIVRDLFKL